MTAALGSRLVSSLSGMLILFVLSTGHATDFQRTDTVPFGTLISIPVTTPWTGTGVMLSPGDVVLITADGIASTEYPPQRLFNWFGPEGGGYLEDHGFGLLTQHSLIGKIGESGTPFQVGRGTHGSVLVGGELYLGYNDAIFGDNHGYFLAYIIAVHEGFVNDVGGNSLLGGGTVLAQSSPNPSRASTRISFTLASSGAADLSIYDAQGRMVRRLVSERMNAGPHVIGWDGRGDSGDLLPSGAYFYSLQVDRQVVGTQKTILLSR